MITDFKILSDLPENTNDYLLVQCDFNIEVTNSNTNLKRVSTRSISFPRIDWNKPEMCDIDSGLLRQQALSIPIVRTEVVMNKDEAVCVVNSMCDQLSQNVYTRSVRQYNLIKTVVRSVVVNDIIGIMIAESVEICNDSGTRYG